MYEKKPKYEESRNIRNRRIVTLKKISLKFKQVHEKQLQKDAYKTKISIKFHFICSLSKNGQFRLVKWVMNNIQI